jgi:hypothetical protein
MPAFSFERVKSHTGKVQYRTDGASAVTVAGRTIRRGEVVEFAKAQFANSLVANGNFAHVPGDTPTGVPASLSPFTETETAEAAAPAETTSLLIEEED